MNRSRIWESLNKLIKKYEQYPILTDDLSFHSMMYYEALITLKYFYELEFTGLRIESAMFVDYAKKTLEAGEKKLHQYPDYIALKEMEKVNKDPSINVDLYFSVIDLGLAAKFLKQNFFEQYQDSVILEFKDVISKNQNKEKLIESYSRIGNLIIEGHYPKEFEKVKQYISEQLENIHLKEMYKITKVKNNFNLKSNLNIIQINLNFLPGQQLELIELMYSLLQPRLINCTLSDFKRHFIQLEDNNLPIEIIQWVGTEPQIKFFFKWLKDNNIILETKVNQIIARHFKNRHGNAFKPSQLSVATSKVYFDTLELIPAITASIKKLVLTFN